MNHKITYQIEFFNYWHAGSGLSGSTYADDIVNKTENELPFIPGKTIKGLLRDAADNINYFNKEMVSDEFIKNIFGARADEGNTNYLEEGKAFFSNAGLSKTLSKEIIKASFANELYTVISSTKIDENGQAIKSSLRQMEVTIPLTLYGNIENAGQYEKEFDYCFGWIKQIGQNRNRGLGKCKFSIINKV